MSLFHRVMTIVYKSSTYLHFWNLRISHLTYPEIRAFWLVEQQQQRLIFRNGLFQIQPKSELLTCPDGSRILSWLLQNWCHLSIFSMILAHNYEFCSRIKMSFGFKFFLLIFISFNSKFFFSFSYVFLYHFFSGQWLIQNWLWRFLKFLYHYTVFDYEMLWKTL